MRFDHAPVTWHHFCSITGSVPTTIHYAVRIGSQNPNLEAKRSAMTLTERRKCFEVAAFLMLAPSIWTQSYLISGYPPGSPKPPLPPWQPRSTAWRPLGSTRTSSNSSATPQLQKAASQKCPRGNLLPLLPARGPRTTANPSSRD